MSIPPYAPNHRYKLCEQEFYENLLKISVAL